MWYYVICEQRNNESFCCKIEKIQYNAALDITGKIRGTSQSCTTRWVLNLQNVEDGLDDYVLSLKTEIHGKLEYLLNKIPSSQIHYNTRNTDQIETYYL